MDTLPKTSSEIVNAGFVRICADFNESIAPFGFKRPNKRSRVWSRQNKGQLEQSYFHRSGSSYGAPINNSVNIRVHFSVKVEDQEPPTVIGGPSSDQLRDSKDYAYHLRFNALTWSTYDRCLEDLMRVTHDHGLPWFLKQNP